MISFRLTGRAEREAIRWFDWLDRARLSSAEVDQFWSWKSDPTNALAYEKVWARRLLSRRRQHV